MLIHKRNAILFIIFYMVAFYGWLFIFSETTWLRVTGASVFPIIGGSVSIYWLLRAYRSFSAELKKFSILLNFGIFFHLSSNFYWLMVMTINGETGYPHISYFMWITGYGFFLVALIYKLKSLYKSISMGPILSNIFIFMIAALSLSFHYLINPIIELSRQYDSVVMINILYPIIDLGILFIAINIFYMSRYAKESKQLLFLSLGFFLQIIADSFYASLLISGNYMNGSLIDPIWMLAILTIGLSSFYVPKEQKEPTWEFQTYSVQGSNGLLLNLSVIFLAILFVYITHWEWNALIIGFSVMMIVILIRQTFMMRTHLNLLKDLSFHAYHDRLTGLKNRASYQEDIYDLIHFAKENNKRFAVLLLDLDRFKNVNDTLGHEIGDLLLKECAAKLKESVSKDDRVYRVGGDEFIIILPDATEEYCITVGNAVIAKFSRPLMVNNYQISITPSIGISLYPDSGKSSDILLKNADTSMYLAKNKGRNQFEFYSSELSQIMARKMLIENDLSNAIQKNQFSLLYQPKVDLHSREIVGTEALLRWKHPKLGYIAPDEFIPIAEDTGHIVSIGEWVLTNACKQLKEWHDSGYKKLGMSVNVSVLQFQHIDFLKNVKKIIAQTDISPEYLELEITESVMQNIIDSTRILHELHQQGIRTSIDDFGTGYSSLSVLKKLPIDAIKIDRTFIEDLSDIDMAMVKAIIDIGLNLKLDVIIEGIEYEEQVTALLDCSEHYLYGQGYLFGKPLPAEAFENVLSLGSL